MGGESDQTLKEDQDSSGSQVRHSVEGVPASGNYASEIQGWEKPAGKVGGGQELGHAGLSCPIGTQGLGAAGPAALKMPLSGLGWLGTLCHPECTQP